MEQVLLKAEQAAALLGLGRSQVYRMAADGLLPTVRLGRAVRIPAAALRVWIEERIRGGSAPVHPTQTPNSDG